MDQSKKAFQENILIDAPIMHIPKMGTMERMLKKLLKWYEDTNRIPISEKKKTQFDKLIDAGVSLNESVESTEGDIWKHLELIHDYYMDHIQDPHGRKTYFDTLMEELEGILP